MITNLGHSQLDGNAIAGRNRISGGHKVGLSRGRGILIHWVIRGPAESISPKGL